MMVKQNKLMITVSAPKKLRQRGRSDRTKGSIAKLQIEYADEKTANDNKMESFGSQQLCVGSRNSTGIPTKHTDSGTINE
jgi:hypothetical protein